MKKVVLSLALVAMMFVSCKEAEANAEAATETVEAAAETAVEATAETASAAVEAVK